MPTERDIASVPLNPVTKAVSRARARVSPNYAIKPDETAFKLTTPPTRAPLLRRPHGQLRLESDPAATAAGAAAAAGEIANRPLLTSKANLKDARRRARLEDSRQRRPHHNLV